MNLYLIRHGETAYNRDGQGLGRADVGLTDRGMEQAAAVAEALAGRGLARVYSSPLARAHIVARLIGEATGAEVEKLDALTELDVGETEGMGFAEMRQRFPEFLSAWGGAEGWRARMPGGESIEDLLARLAPLAEELRAAEDDVAVVSHNFALRALLTLLLQLEPAQWRAFQLDLCSVTTLTGRNGRFGVRSVNDTCHLSRLNLA